MSFFAEARFISSDGVVAGSQEVDEDEDVPASGAVGAGFWLVPFERDDDDDGVHDLVVVVMVVAALDDDDSSSILLRSWAERLWVMSAMLCVSHRKPPVSAAQFANDPRV